jgi:hypothetical protein
MRISDSEPRLGDGILPLWPSYLVYTSCLKLRGLCGTLWWMVRKLTENFWAKAGPKGNCSESARLFKVQILSVGSAIEGSVSFDSNFSYDPSRRAYFECHGA